MISWIRAASSRQRLPPAEVNQVVILDESKKLALGIVPVTFVAIGKQGLTRRGEPVQPTGTSTSRRKASSPRPDLRGRPACRPALFGEPEEEIQKISELPGITPRLWRSSKKHIGGIYKPSPETCPVHLRAGGFTARQQIAPKIIEENVEIVEEEPAAGAYVRPRGRRSRTGR